MKKYLTFMILILVLSVGAVCAEDPNQTDEADILSADSKSFTDLETDIAQSGDVFDITDDYTFNNKSDISLVVIEKSNFTINGNNYILDGNRQSGIFNITGNNVTINNLVFINGNSAKGGAIYATGQITLNNVTFINNNATRGGAIYSTGQVTLNNVTFINNYADIGGIFDCRGGAIANYNGTVNCNNARFIDNHAELRGSSIYLENAALNINNSFVTSCLSSRYGQIYAVDSKVTVDNSDFVNMTSIYSPALYLQNSESSIINSRFVNLTANITAGAIAIRYSGNTYIKGCKFINTKSSKNAGAINVDYGNKRNKSSIIDCVFENTSSMIGGAYVQLGGILTMDNSNFTNNRATYDGGAAYLSFASININDCIFDSNGVDLLDDYAVCGGAIYCDKGYLRLADSRFINNFAYQGNAIYAYESRYNIANCVFANNTNAIYTYFDGVPSNLNNNTYDNDSVVTNDSFAYKSFFDTPALNLTLVNNTINVTGLPSRFDLRDWGLVTPVKDQGRMGACWTFAMINAVESALLKAYGIEFDLSEGDMFHKMIRYSPYGYSDIEEWGSAEMSTSYLVGWYGPVLEEYDIYDEVGKLSPLMKDDYDVFHVQDVIIVPNDEVPEGSKIKTAILNYGALDASYFGESDDEHGYYNPETSAQYTNENLGANHEVSVIGWDDNFSKDNFLITPPGDGAWICKNSWGTDWGDDGILYISYYDKTFLTGELIIDNAFGIVIENTIPYNKNYQHDFLWAGDFMDMNQLMGVNGNITYANQFEAAADDLIAAVGTYFNESGVDYTVEIYVNDELKLTQDGKSPFCGYHTIKLNEYIPVKEGDIFRAAITSNTMPYCYGPWSRVHYTENMSFFRYDGEWMDLRNVEYAVACLKVYTVEDTDHIINYTFSDLARHINESGDVLEISHDYTFDNRSDEGPVVIRKSNFTINGNNHILDGNGQSKILIIIGENVTINNLAFINGNGNSDYGGAIDSIGQLTLNNATFANNSASRGGAVMHERGAINFNNCCFIDNYAEAGSAICSENTEVNVCNSFITSGIPNKYGQIFALSSIVNMDNVDFVNISSTYAPALYLEDSESSIINSRFVNLTAYISAGAIAVRYSGNTYIKGCAFINTKSSRNIGAVIVDYGMASYNATITDCVFENASSMIGSAYMQLGGNLILNSSNFTNNKAFGAGAVYISFTNSTIDNCIFDSNELSDDSGPARWGGAIYCDMSNMTLANSRFTNNSAYLGNAIYACDSWYNITNCLFADNKNAIYTDFDDDSCNLKNNAYNNDSIITNQSYYAPLSFEYPALNLTLTNNTINVNTLPSRFDLRDWGWNTPVKQQGQNGACWVFGFTEALQTALLKATGIRYDISENYIQNLQIRYSDFGSLIFDEGGVNYMALANVLSWLDVGENEEEYDEVGKLSVFVDSANKIRLQDAYLIMPDTADYVGDIKKAILNYGAVSIAYASSSDKPYFNVKTSAQYTNESLPGDHVVAVIGWDDNYSADNFLIAPPGDGAWIVKNSWGTDWGDKGYFYLSYYEKSFFTPDIDTNRTYPFTACIFTNAIDYHVNYQTDLTGLYGFDGNYTQYSNEFTAKYDDLIAGVGTFFNQSGINYSFDVYVNNKLAHSQSGVSEFAGYRTIVLSKYIPVNANDTFKVVFKSNAVPYEAYSRNHYIQGMSFVSADGSTWSDITLEGKTICLKVYTVAVESKLNASITADDCLTVLVGDLKDGQMFNLTLTSDGVALANRTVTITFNGATSDFLTDENGMISYELSVVSAGNYTIDMEFAGDALYNPANASSTVNVVKAESKIYLRNALYFVTQTKMVKVTLWDENNNPIAGKTVRITIGDLTWSGTTDENGTASIRVGVGYGNHNATVSFDGDDEYSASERTGVVRVIKETPSIMLRGADSKFNAKDPNKTVKIYLWDRESKPLPVNSKVAIKINGQTYIGFTDSEGIARINIDIAKAGTYQAELKFAGNSAYNAVTRQTKIEVRD